MDGRVRKQYVSDLHARTSFRRKGSDELTAYICHLADSVSFTLGGLVLAVWLRLGIPIRSPELWIAETLGRSIRGVRELMGLFGLQTILKRRIAFYPPLMVLHIA